MTALYTKPRRGVRHIGSITMRRHAHPGTWKSDCGWFWLIRRKGGWQLKPRHRTVAALPTFQQQRSTNQQPLILDSFANGLAAIDEIVAGLHAPSESQLRQQGKRTLDRLLTRL